MAKNKLMNSKKITASPSPTPMDMDRKWQAEDDMRTLTRAEEVKSDKGRMKAVSEHAKKQVDHLKKFC